MDYFIYILYSEKFDKYYVGQTQNYKQRLLHHNTDDKNTFTSKYRPWILKAVFKVVGDRGVALKTEKFVKRQKSKSLILKLINPDFVPDGKLSQLVRVPQVRD